MLSRQSSHDKTAVQQAASGLPEVFRGYLQISGEPGKAWSCPTGHELVKIMSSACRSRTKSVPTACSRQTVVTRLEIMETASKQSSLSSSTGC